MELTVILGAAALVSSLFVLWWAVSGERGQTGAIDLAVPEASHPVDMRTIVLRQGVSERMVRPLLERLGERARRITPVGRVAALNRKIIRAGSPAGWTVDRVIATKVLLALILGALLLLRFAVEPSPLNLLLAIVALLFGYFVPDGLLDSKVNARQLATRLELSDTIDQLTVMVRAGLGIDAAIARTARAGKGPLGEEFTRVMQDMRVGVSRGVALTSMSERIDIVELRTFVAALAQAEKLGVPVAQTLQIQAEELRVRRRQLTEEQAMKLPVKILFPMVICILPVIFIVILGPAAIRIFEQFSK